GLGRPGAVGGGRQEVELSREPFRVPRQRLPRGGGRPPLRSRPPPRAPPPPPPPLRRPPPPPPPWGRYGRCTGAPATTPVASSSGAIGAKGILWPTYSSISG